MMTDRSELEEALRRAKFCIKRRAPVNWQGLEYFLSALILRYDKDRGFIYLIELTDPKRLNSTVTVGLSDIELPTEGGGFKLEPN